MAKNLQTCTDLPRTGYLRLPQVLNFIPIGQSTWWKGVKEGRFPKPIKLGPKTTAWRAEDILQLLEDFNNDKMNGAHTSLNCDGGTNR